MKKHGNVKYKFHDLIKVGDMIIEKPKNIYSLKAAFRNYNLKREKDNLPTLVVQFDEYTNRRVDITLRRLDAPKQIETNLATLNASTNTITGQENREVAK